MPERAENQASSETAKESTSDFESHMRKLRIRYLETMKELLVPVEAALRHCEDGTLREDDRIELRTIAHRLAGTGETYGFPAITAAGRPIDNRLRQEPDIPPPDLMQLIYPLVIACRNAMGRDEIHGARPPRAQFGLRRTALETAPEAPHDKIAVRPPLMLVVDDDPAMRDLFTDLFSDETRIVTAVNSDEALVMMRRHRPDLVLLDDIMPGAITGLKFLETLQKSGEFPDTPIIMITASDAPEHIERGLNAGAAGYITKPFDPAAAAVTIRRFFPPPPRL